MVSSGLVDKNKTKEIDKAPRVSPYRLSTHAGFAYSLYTVRLWQAMNLLRWPQEATVTSFQKLAAINDMRTRLRRIAFFILPFVLVTGYFTAGTNAGASCNTFPKVGSNWFYNSNHFLDRDEVPLWKNFTENKLICQVNHRTLASIMTIWATWFCFKTSRLTYLPPLAKRSLLFLAISLWVQMFIGMNVIWNSVPIWLASSHQFGALTVLTCIIYAHHNARRVDPRHVKNMLGKLKIEDKTAFDQMMKWQMSKTKVSAKEL